MRVLVLMFVAACAGAPHRATPPAPVPVPADDIGDARGDARPADSRLVVKDPRVIDRTIDLDIIRIRATQSSPGAAPELDAVATADLFRIAGDAARRGARGEAIGRYRQLVTEFPQSLYAPVSLFNIAALLDAQGDPVATITVLRELVATYPEARESIEGHLFIAALQAERQQWADSITTLDEALARTNLTFADRVEAYARRGYALLELARYDEADVALAAAHAEWRRAPRVEDAYYIAMATYYRGEIAHRRFVAAPVRLPDETLIADLDAKRALAVQAYDRWKEALGFGHAYWGTAAGYQMSQIFVELWDATVRAPYPTRLAPAQRDRYLTEVHERVRVHLEKALEGHRMNLALAKAYGVDTTWSQGSAQRALQVMQLLDQEGKGNYTRPNGP
jgi:hypothetical protein